MHLPKNAGLLIAGSGAGIINGLFGAGGGMILVPLLQHFHCIEDKDLFPSSLAIMLPICILTLSLSASLPWTAAMPYLLGGSIGGVIAGIFGRKIKVLWLHRILGGLILWGGIRYLWP